MPRKISLYLIIHIILWIGYLGLPLLTELLKDSSIPNVNPYTTPIFWIYSSASFIFLFYFNSVYLFPKIYKEKGKQFQYVLILLIIISGLVFLRFLIRINFVGEVILPIFILNAFFQYIFIFGISTSYRFFSDYQTEQRIQREKENERLKSELSFLRSQISPHFMFNLLNSMVSLARKKSNLLEPVLLKMSELLRYMLYDKDDKKIDLEHEIEYLKSYVELQKLRFGDTVEVNFRTENYMPNNTIEPMLLIPFIENSFKHGIGLIDKPKIDIFLENKEKELNFMVSNKYNDESNEPKDSASGIGLQNIRRRLELLYPENYFLKINQEKGIFKTELKLNLK